MYSLQGETTMTDAEIGKIKAIKAKYKAGSTVSLISMQDAQGPKPGTLGKVSFVDDVGTVHVDWENGSSLGVIIGIDSIALLS